MGVFWRVCAHITDLWFVAEIVGHPVLIVVERELVLAHRRGDPAMRGDRGKEKEVQYGAEGHPFAVMRTEWCGMQECGQAEGGGEGGRGGMKEWSWVCTQCASRERQVARSSHSLSTQIKSMASSSC